MRPLCRIGCRERERRARGRRRALSSTPRLGSASAPRLADSVHRGEPAGIPEILHKRPLTGYLIYTQWRRPQLPHEYGRINLPEGTKIIAKEWRNMDVADKQQYLDDAAERKAAYGRALDALAEEDRHALVAQKRRKMHATKRRLAKKRGVQYKQQLASEHGMPSPGPPLPVSLYVAEQSALLEPHTTALGGGVFLPRLAKQYKRLSDEQKKPYKERASVARAQYERDLAEWCDMMVQRGQLDILEALVPKRTWSRLLAERYHMPSRLRRPFAIFMSDNPGRSMVELGKVWRADPNLKTEYKAKFEHMKKGHVAEMDEWVRKMQRNSLDIVARALVDYTKRSPT